MMNNIQWKAQDIAEEAQAIADDRADLLGRLNVAKLILEDAQQLVAMIEADEARTAVTS